MTTPTLSEQVAAVERAADTEKVFREQIPGFDDHPQDEAALRAAASTLAEMQTGGATAWRCAKCGYGPAEHAVPGRVSYHCSYEPQLMPTPAPPDVLEVAAELEAWLNGIPGDLHFADDCFKLRALAAKLRRSQETT